MERAECQSASEVCRRHALATAWGEAAEKHAVSAARSALNFQAALTTAKLF